MDDQKSISRIIKIIRQAARFSSLLVIIVVGLVIAGNYIFPDLRETQPPNENLFRISLLISVAGLIMAWRWELLGGALNILFFIFMYLSYWAVNNELFPLRGLWIIGLAIVPGILFLVCWNKSRRSALGAA